MALTLTSLQQIYDLDFDDIIDVRAPAEWAEDHIPGAINLPVLDDAERARVGTIYKQVNPFTARKLGAALVARNAATHLEGVSGRQAGGLAAADLLLARRSTVGVVCLYSGAGRLAGGTDHRGLQSLARAGGHGAV